MARRERSQGSEVRSQKSEVRSQKLEVRSQVSGVRGPVEVVAIGTSTGGPNALAEVLGALPAGFPVPIVIVQHMPPMFTRLLAERLSAQFPIRVQEGSSGGVLEPGHAWIAPGD